MCSNPGKRGLVMQVGPQSRSSTGISISITSIKSPKAQHSINVGDHIQIQLATIHSTRCRYLGHLEGCMVKDPSQHEQGGELFLSKAATTDPDLHIHTHTHTHTLHTHVHKHLHAKADFHYYIFSNPPLLSTSFFFFHLFNGISQEYYFLSSFHFPTPLVLYGFISFLNFSILVTSSDTILSYPFHNPVLLHSVHLHICLLHIVQSP